MINFTASNTTFYTATIALFAIVGTACGTAATTNTAELPATPAAAEAPTVQPAPAATEAPTTDAPAAVPPVANDAPTTPAPAIETAPIVEQPVVQPQPVVDVTPAAEAPAPQPQTSIDNLDIDDHHGPEIEQYINHDLAARQFLPASGYELPCQEYYTNTEYPLVPCDKGPLVEEFQNIAKYIDPDFVVDGYFGPDTMDFVQEMQRSFGLWDTGIIDQVLIELIDQSILHAEPVDYEDSGEESEGHTITDAEKIEICNSYNPNPNEELNWDLINACDDLGIQLISGD